MKAYIVILIVFIIFGCQQAPSKPVKVDEKINYAKNLEYFKDGHGICYAALTSFNFYGSTISITTIPCNKLNKDTSMEAK